MSKSSRKIILSLLALTLVGTFFAGCSNNQQNGSTNSKKEVVKIAVGYQTVTSQTWGALIIKNKKLYEKYLEEKYPNKEFQIEWFNAQSGPPLTNNMVAGKLQFAFMGDMPILINGEKGQTSQNYKSVFLAFDGKGEKGKNQAILVPKDSNINSVKDLAGKNVSVPLGSSAHRMLLNELDKYGITDKVNILNQDVTVGMTNIEQNKIDAHASWEPFPSLIENKGIGKTLVDGSDTNVDYLDGIVADRTWVEKNKDYTIALLKSLIEAHKYIRENPEDAAKIFAEESKYPIDVTKKIVKNIRFDSVIYDKDKVTLEGSKDFLKKLDKIKDVDLNKFIDDEYIKQAYKESNLQYPSADLLKGNWQPLK
ncbi:ABC transporter substrate-binding protein [Clostridium kluyveri]|uniref:Putative aliphatic sulfonates-binding protein n=2 Tax=Clostridium kluyveri TaxID=1534 RepID=A5N1R8_CLOK5|nr:ABC transporter substrate-binding protein [Clostridium kluyveri]EDK35064.1 Predicted ABC transporter, extracellular solute binding protein [Clostridium kluyveri DSM 555]